MPLWPAPCGDLSPTPSYTLALLQVLMARVYGKEVDIWSLGVVLYIVLGGYAPFDGACEQQVGSSMHLRRHWLYRGCTRKFSACCIIAMSVLRPLHQPGSSTHPTTSYHGALTTPRAPFHPRCLTPPAPGMPCLSAHRS